MNEDKLTPQQSADVISWMYREENKKSLRNNWRMKKSLVEVSLMAARASHSPLSDDTSLLSFSEAAAGVEYINDQSEDEDISDEDNRAIEDIVDRQNVPYAIAREVWLAKRT